MSIQVVCPNGHPLTVDDSCAGRIGLCPVCKAPVKVPQADNRPISEDATLDFLGTPVLEPTPPKSLLPRAARTARPEITKYSKRQCGHCKREVIASLLVCPYCHVQIAAASGDSTPCNRDDG